ncbi:MAG: response regulator [Oligoflexia bacterium]|nr:response regulator [Oligoflexia bacterium]
MSDSNKSNNDSDMTTTTDKVFKEIRVVIVDDSDLSRREIGRALEKEKISVVGEASNATESMAILQASKAHIAIVDVVMPDVSGIELVRKIHETFPKMFTIVISSLGHQQVVLDAISAGASDFLHKPFSKQILVNSIFKIASQIEEE